MKSHLAPRLLVADDDLSVIAAYRYVLEEQSCTTAEQKSRFFNALEKDIFGKSTSESGSGLWRIHFVDQGQDAVDAVKASVRDGDRFAAIFLDIRMPPGIDGYDTAALIRKLDPDVHIVFVSGYSDYHVEELEAAFGGLIV